MELPSSIRKEIIASFRTNNKSSQWPEFFIVRDKINLWLIKHLGLTSDCNETYVHPFTFRFDWGCQRWVVK